MKNLFLFLFLILFFGTSLFAQNRLKSPDAFLPHALGVQYTAHHQLVSYFEYIGQQASDRVQVQRFGMTSEERPQLLAIVSSKENMARLEEIRLNNLRRVGTIPGKYDNNNPIAIVWMSYSVHGNEAAGSESSMRVLYDLVTSPEAQIWLQNTVVILDPSQNPDGYDRYTHWYRGASNQVADVEHHTNEHLEPWPGGRVNHYLFDLNRDWAWLTQTESQNKIKMYHQWMPHVHPDIHEQGYNDPYYFAPAAAPYHKYITPFQREFQRTIGINNAKHFDDKGWLYFTREIFDLFYPSYGDTYPTYNGAIGMTYEQGGIGAGRSIINEAGDTLTLKDRVDHHYTTSMSTVEISSKYAKDLVTNFTAFFQKAQTGGPGDYKTYVIKGDNDANKLRAFCKLLDAHEIRYGSVSKTQNLTGYNYLAQTEGAMTVTDKDLVVLSAQPMSTIAQILLDPKAMLEDSMTYDITAWSLPYAYNLETFASKQGISIDKTFELPTITSNLDKNAKPYAYLATWKSVANVKFLAQLFKNNIRVRTASEPFEIEGKKYAAGTLILTRSDNKRLGDGFDTQLRALAKTYNQEIETVSTGMTTQGYDFGSDKVKILTAPKILMLSGDDVDDNAFGHLWYYFEQDLNYAISILPSDKFKRADLSKYNVLILPNGTYELDINRLDKIRDWVAKGGHLILLEEANAFVEDQKGFNLSKYANNKDKDMATDQEDKDKTAHRLEDFHNRERNSISDLTPGAIMKLNMDNTHPLGFGFPRYYYTLKTNTLHFQSMKDTWNVGTTGEKLNINGFSGKNALNKLKNNTVFGVQDLGKGSVIYMMDSPVFRGFWHEGKLLMGNAVFMVGQ